MAQLIEMPRRVVATAATVAEASAEAIRKIAMAIGSEGGLQAVNLK